jgi:hypothetical protein
MTKISSKINWLLDLVILIGFLLLFFLNITGVSLHQWLGLGIFLLIMIHLINHWDWVKSIFANFFHKTSGRARFYAILDAFLLLGLVMIIETGLVISTWFNLSMGDYATWSNIHTDVSIATLLILVLKVGLHWKWIVTNARKIFHPTARPQPVSLPVGNPSMVSRRQFLTTMGIVSLGSALAIANVLPRSNSSQSTASAESESNSISQSNLSTTSQSVVTPEAAQPTRAPAASTTVQEVAPATTQPTELPTVQTALNCYATCCRGNHCSFPGQCRQYTDSNGNGLCDLGECS